MGPKRRSRRIRTDARRDSFPELDAARALVADIRASQPQIDEERALPQSLTQALTRAGMFRMLLPSRLGGAELPLSRYIRCIEVIAEADGSTGWCTGQGGVFPNLADRMTDAAADDIWTADPDAVVATGSPSGSTALATTDGFRLNGRWKFASGVTHATWLAAMAPTVNDAGDVIGFGMFMVPRAEIQLHDGWNVRGLRGTGSREYVLDNVDVPTYRSMDGPVLRDHCGAATGLPAQLIFASAFGCVGLGIARRAIDEVKLIIAGKTPFSTSRKLLDDDMVHLGLGEAEALWGAARAFLFELAEACSFHYAEHGEVSGELRTHLRLAATNAMRQSGAVVDRTYELAGSDVIFDDHPLQRCFQDVRALTQQIQARPAHFRTVGRVLLGLDPDNAVL